MNPTLLEGDMEVSGNMPTGVWMWTSLEFRKGFLFYGSLISLLGDSNLIVCFLLRKIALLFW
jgi:hypothetical protein